MLSLASFNKEEVAMFAIVVSGKDGELIFYGPFESREAVTRYVSKPHRIIGMFAVVQLRDCGDAMDA